MFGPSWPRQLSRFAWLLPLTLLLAACTSPVRKLADAQKLQNEGRYAAAIGEFSEVLARVPDDQRQLISLIELHIGECQWAMGEPKAALLSLQNSLEDDPEKRRTRLRLGELMLAGGAPQNALEHASWLLARDSANLDALTLLGGVYAALGDAVRAQGVFERVLVADPSRANAALTLAQIYATTGQQDKARNVLHRSANVRSTDAAPWLALARLEEETGNNIAAEQSYRKAVAGSGDPETKLRLAQFLARASRISEAEQVLAEVDQHLPPSSTFRADFELLLGRALEAVAGYTSVLRHSSSSAGSVPAIRKQDKPALSRPLLIARLVEAELALAHKQAQRAERLQHASALLAEHRAELDAATFESLQAEVSLVSGDIPQAEVHSSRALELAPQSAAANFVAGLVQSAAHDFAAANQYWNSALEKDPDFLPARQAVAARTLLGGDAASAEEYILPVVREEPANFDALCIYARALAAQGQIFAAGLITRRALAADGDSAEPHLILGDIAMRQGRWGSAFIEYQQAVLLEPDSSEAMAGLAGVYRKGRITRPLLRRMEKVAGNPPASASLMEVVGRLYADHGWHTDAERALRRATKFDPSRATAATALARAYAHGGKQRAATDSLAAAGESTAELIAGLRAAAEKDTPSAVRSYEVAIRRGESSGAAANNLAWIYAQNGIELDRALELAQLARRLAPQDPAVLDTVGFVQLKRREYSQAVQTLKQAVELALSSAGKPLPARALREVKLHLAEAYLRSGQPQAAATLKKSMP